jgi:hypothetical protein
VLVGRELNEEKQKDYAKRELFLQLFENKGQPISFQFVRNLNRIDVVYHDNHNVLNAWHQYFEALHQKGIANQEKTWELLRTQLLQEMSHILGYGELKPLVLGRHYQPEGHQLHDKDNYDFWLEQKKYYQNSNQLILKVLSDLNQEDDNKE